MHFFDSGVTLRLPTGPLIFAIGDSKTVAVNAGYIGYPPVLLNLLFTETGQSWYELVPRGALYGGTVLNFKNSIIAGALDTYTDIPTYILANWGVNDIDSEGTTQAAFEANYGYVLDALHAKWPNAKIYLMRPWWVTTPESQILMNAMDDTWIPNILSTRGDFAFLGPDERIFLENGDNGATLTDDGCHPNAAGYQATAAAWLSVLPV